MPIDFLQGRTYVCAKCHGTDDVSASELCDICTVLKNKSVWMTTCIQNAHLCCMYYKRMGWLADELGGRCIPISSGGLIEKHWSGGGETVCLLAHRDSQRLLADCLFSLDKITRLSSLWTKQIAMSEGQKQCHDQSAIVSFTVLVTRYYVMLLRR